MKIVHLSDLHLGKRVNEFSMLEDQQYILLQILKIIDEAAPRAVILAGDIYDKSVPSAEAVQLLDDFLCRLARRDLAVFIISGNHDSPERIAFGGRLMERSGIYLSPVYDGKVEPVTLDGVHFYLLPFVKPNSVRHCFPDESIETYTDAVAAAIRHMPILPGRKVLITHQFVTGALRSDSEEISVGGSDNVDASVFGDFDYVALGHIHGPQKIDRETIRYCGTPLKYSFSEKDHVKSVTVVDIPESGNVTVSTVPLVPKRDLRVIRGSYDELTLKANYENTATDDYLQVILTDEEDIPNALAKMRLIYPNIMKLEYDNTRTRSVQILSGPEAVEQKSEMELFAEFYQKQNGQPLSDEQFSFCQALFEKIREGEV